MGQTALQRLVPDAPQALCAILDSKRGTIEPPIRSEIFGLQRFAQHGRSLGETHRSAKVGSRSTSFLPRLRGNIRILREAHRYIGEQASTGYDISPAAEWLLDNFHLIEAQLKEIHDGLPRSYFRTLPMLVDPPLAGLPRVYGIAWAFVAHTDGAFDEDLLAQFLGAYQETCELNLSEMWALPTTLRVVLVESLRRLAERVATKKAARAVANLCCDRIESWSVAALDELLALLQVRGVGHVFLVQMAQRLQDRRTDAVAGHRVETLAWLQRALPDLAAVQMQQPSDQAADNLSVSNAVRSLRAIGDADWPDIVARTSTLMRLMLTQPAFEGEHATTRDQTLHGLELLALRSGRSELSVAQTLLALMHAYDPGNPATAVPSYWLRGPGRPALVRSLGLGAGAAFPWRALARRVALPVYLAALVLGTAGLVAWLLAHYPAPYPESQAGAAAGVWWTVLGATLMLFPASEAMVAVINRLISESARPRHLPRLALADGIPPEHRVMVVIPGMLTNATSARDLLQRLLLHYLANPERNAQFALLSDWADADSARGADDMALLDGAVAQVRALNLRYPQEAGQAAAGPRFILLHRERSFSDSEQRWIGWERKRGKLELLLAALAQGHSQAFLDLGELSRMAANTPYVVTLDSDTGLPPGRLRDLVGIAAHPHNQPRLDAASRTVVGGYGILQPRIVTPLPAHQDFTLYHWLFAGHCGTDPYSAATSEVYQDVFGEGTFTGKGLLHVQAVHAVLGGRLPQGRVLSHDLLEGALARCAAATDVTVIEDAPFHADVAASRLHRWMRGDWQLLPLMLQPGRYATRAINRWKMFDNLRRSLVAPMSLALLVLALAGSDLSPWTALALVLAASSAGPLMGAVAGFSPSRDDIAKRHFYSQAGTDLLRVLWGGLWLLTQLPSQALLAVDAVARALYRMGFSQRLLLQWTTAEAAQAQASTSLRALVRKHWREPALALLLLAALLAGGTPTPQLALLLCLIWTASPLWIWCVSCKRPAREDVALSPQDRHYLEKVARDTWGYFERSVTADDNHLPPDNLQTTPQDMLAHRTSPTNIGLYLLSTACARAFGWIDTQQLLARLEATLATLATLQRHRGHFLNWYDTQTRAPLLPMYVSTVDSGNLSGHLLAVAQACRELAPQQAAATDGQAPGPGTAPLADTQDRLLALAARCEQLAFEADFGFLYHRKRHLLHIGYRVAEQQLDASFYDLLASESRLTSLLAIAKGDVPVRHWASLGRPFFAVGTLAGLRSWSGSMFEYLMPALVLEEPDGSVLRDACHAALVEQIAFARARAVPWGISESAYAASDHTLAYQYAPQGVPRLALRRTPPDELVVAPYATALAALIAPHRAIANLRALEVLSARAAYGFIEALDFTASRQGGDAAFTPVSTFMAHHQGMGIVALANVLLGGVAQRWGMANAHIQSVASLLHERTPREVSVLYAPPTGPSPQTLQRRAPGLLRDMVPGTAALEPTHVLSNGRYTVTLRANGAGWSRWGQTGITRFRDDALRDACGSFFYLRALSQGPDATALARRKQADARLFSITQHPAPDPRARYQSIFHADRVCFDAVWPEVQAHTTVWVSPEDDIEFRKIEVRNLSAHTLEVELISGFEVTLADPRADEAHPAFSNLFVRATWQQEHQALVFERKPRLPGEPGMQAAHFLTQSDPQVVDLRIQTDRQRWLGRNRSASHPLASFDALPVGAGGDDAELCTGLDPVACLAVRLRIAPNASAKLTFATAASDNGGTLRAVIDKYRQPGNVQRASLMSATLTGIRLRTLALGADSFAAVQLLSTALVLNLTRPQVRPEQPPDAGLQVCDRRLLWRFGISGDRPILLVSAGVTQGLGLLRSLAQGLSLWAWGGVACDLVIVNTEAASYLMVLQREISALRERHLADSGTLPGAASTGLHLLRADEISTDELSTLQALARVQLNADGRPLAHHVQDWSESHQQALDQRQDGAATLVAVVPRPDAAITAPAGQFAAASGDFRFDVNAHMRPLRPWMNVLANSGFGAHISESGGGYTWARNSRLNQLTGWSNDPVADTPSEWFLLQDRKTLEVWGTTASSWGDGSLTYHVSHGQGSTTFQHRRGDLEVTATWCVDAARPVKQVRIRITNQGHRTQHLRLVGIAEWTMGANRSDRSSVHSAAFHQLLDPGERPDAQAGGSGARQLTALLCTQRERAGGFGEGTAFLAIAAATEAAPDWTCDRRECFDASGRLVLPDHFGQHSGVGLDPCAALSTKLRLPPGETTEHVFLLGHADSPDGARRLAVAAAAVPAAQRMDQARQTWDQLLGATSVKTPDPLFDAMVNRWLLYQTVVCRLWAKAGFYQAGGATGFRDQLQDAMALAWAAPAMLREQIVLGASRQFAAGDVQHWWHAPTGAGVRTHFSDDLLWLPWATLHYLHATGDATLLDEPVPFIEGADIPAGAEDAYYTPTTSAESASVFEHGARAIDHSLRVGVHGLPLMGSGDWNDGMNRVGILGRGESVWLGWFLCRLVADFAPLARTRGEAARAQRWEEAAQGWKAALNGTAWDGQWFKRAFFDDGQALGSHANAEARIDLIAQAWSVLSQAAQPALQRLALAAMDTHLVDPQNGLIKLLDPPLAHALPSAGYIQAYPPGVRENGGQYSHAGVWALMAQAQAWVGSHSAATPEAAKAQGSTADGADAPYRYFTYLSPAHRARHPAHGAAYGIEPYVMAGDVYSQPPYVGRGGWSWYTGSAAWMHRAAIESIFGLQQGTESLFFTPCLPSHWRQAELTLRRDGRTMRFILVRGTPRAALEASAAQQAVLLRRGELLSWRGLAPQTCYVVPLLDDDAGTGSPQT